MLEKNLSDNDSTKEIENLDDHLSKIVLTPNFPNTKNIFSNIALSYGNELLYQKHYNP